MERRSGVFYSVLLTWVVFAVGVVSTTTASSLQYMSDEEKVALIVRCMRDNLVLVRPQPLEVPTQINVGLIGFDGHGGSAYRLDAAELKKMLEARNSPFVVRTCRLLVC